MFLTENNLCHRENAMRLLSVQPAVLITLFAAPTGAVAAFGNSIPHLASIAAVILWLAALGWGFHAMLHHRLAAEDRLAQLETNIVFERDARAAQVDATRQGLLRLESAWLRLEACLVDGDTRHVPACMHAMENCIAQLQHAA
jgi:hypothetical protein